MIDALTRKARLALERGPTTSSGQAAFKSLGLSGGVANNRALRAALEVEANRASVSFFAAQPKHTGDNAGMIAFAAWADTMCVGSAAGMTLGVEPGAVLIC